MTGKQVKTAPGTAAKNVFGQIPKSFGTIIASSILSSSGTFSPIDRWGMEKVGDLPDSKSMPREEKRGELALFLRRAGDELRSSPITSLCLRIHAAKWAVEAGLVEEAKIIVKDAFYDARDLAAKLGKGPDIKEFMGGNSYPKEGYGFMAFNSDIVGNLAGISGVPEKRVAEIAAHQAWENTAVILSGCLEKIKEIHDKIVVAEKA